MRWALLAMLVLTTPAASDDSKQPDKAKIEKPKPACKNRVMGKGKDRKVVCVYEEEILVVSGGPAKPAVVIAPADGRKVTGRPKLTDPLDGLSRRRSTAR